MAGLSLVEEGVARRPERERQEEPGVGTLKLVVPRS